MYKTKPKFFMLYYSNNQACIIYMQNKQTAYVAVEGYFCGQAVHDFMDKLVELCKRSDVKKMLIDSSKIEVLKTDDINWINQNIYPQLKKIHIEKISLVKPQSIFGEVSVNKLIPKDTNKVIQKFAKIEEAETWLFN